MSFFYQFLNFDLEWNGNYLLINYYNNTFDVSRSQVIASLDHDINSFIKEGNITDTAIIWMGDVNIGKCPLPAKDMCGLTDCRGVGLSNFPHNPYLRYK